MIERVSGEGAGAQQRSTIWRWWRSLHEEDRAGRAELRRCSTPGEVAFTAPYHRLLRRLGSRLGERDLRRVAALAAVLSHIESEPADRASLPERMGAPKGDSGGQVVSDVRFRHLLRSEAPEDLMVELIRVVRQLDRMASVDQLFDDLMRWDEKTRRRWARDYYSNDDRRTAKES